MAKVSEIFEKLALRAPVELKMGFDNVGHLAGRGDREARRVLVTLDITDAVIAEAKALGAELIVSHHPLTFEGLKAVTEADMTGRKFLAIIEAGMSAICMHTNLDAATGGVNDALAETGAAAAAAAISPGMGRETIAGILRRAPWARTGCATQGRKSPCANSASAAARERATSYWPSRRAAIPSSLPTSSTTSSSGPTRRA